MTTRRNVLGLIGLAAPSWAIPSWAAAAAQTERHLSLLVRVDDPQVQVIENAWIPMPDGTRLAARIFLPQAAATKPAGAVLEYLPYRKRDAYRYRDDVAGPFLAKSGIAMIRVDIRGTGDSDGAMVDEYMPIEQADALAVIDWIAHQPWCNGNVGMRGISYGSFVALQAAAKAPAALKAIVSTCGTEQRYLDDIHYRGGCLINDQFVWAMEWQVIMRAPPDPVIVGADHWRALWQQRLEASGPMTILWNEHQTLDGKWRDGSIQDYERDSLRDFQCRRHAGRLSAFRDADDGARTAGCAEGADRSLGAQMAGLSATRGPSGRRRRRPPTDPRARESIGCRSRPVGGATGCWARPMESCRSRAFGRSARTSPPGATFPRDTAGSWVSEPNWPSKEIQTRTWHFNADGLAERAGSEVLIAHRTNLTIGFANRWSGASGDPQTWWRDQAADDARCLKFDTAPLAESIDIMGEPVFKIRVRSDKPIAKLCARLTEVMPDGRSHFVSFALLNLTHRDSDAAPAALVPGRDYDVSLRGHFACYRFARGSRIRVALSETWWPVVWPSPDLVTLEVTTGASMVELPVRPSREGETPPFAVFSDRYAKPGAPASPYGTIRSRAWKFPGVRAAGSSASRKVHSCRKATGSTAPAERPIKRPTACGARFVKTIPTAPRWRPRRSISTSAATGK